MHNRLVWQLFGAFVLVILVGALVIYFTTSQATQTAFRLYTTQNSQIWAERLAPDYAEYYAQNGSWQNVADLMQAAVTSSSVPGAVGGMGNGMGRGRGFGSTSAMASGMGQRLILSDAQGRVVADTALELTGSQLTADEIASGAPVEVKNQVVGTLIATPREALNGANPAALFLRTVNNSILVSVLVAGLLSLALLFLLSYQITAPIRQMQAAAAAIAGGHLDQRVQVRARNELGDLAETFNHMASRLAISAEQRKKLLADVAHELRTPLAVIQAHVEGMQDGVLSVDPDQLNTIHEETLLLGRLINDLKLISLAESGELRLECTPVDIGVLLRTVLDHFQPQCTAKAIRLISAISDELPEVMVDSDRIAQVMNNLLSNALRYTPEGGTLSVRAECGQQEIKVLVIDTGTGIAPEDLPWVFDRFYRADKSRARSSGGSGLGLAIVKQLVEAHQGSIQVMSPAYHDGGKGFGTCFTVTLPTIR